ncbi:hypothetical protein B0I72DRAFT_38311 [Yarrowia lipolytica]|uniref:Uncharacterized protein n=1 Tax=Yarrowia lipolytica TaxID=4952 RepID=A0A371C8I8_YARLL|nr:hypothetical protein BKA91DRAFT_44220 [Yarrowia lipolytica]KAE8169535.1 hypothetical protein BKA90DRAFT_47304 [Yarrowia lipolytica]RDW26623.1 hypothetical protein B0I71DRAFT_29879 [Yarrowia lipolytica]RDW32390.1 hypothetical protein B0I72DRAFT_38311 [Yarrowia lipolytica]RDW41811.1 hypothetical protein B0I73DRAFT_44572 [Yarrowia lipolytica]
MTKSSNLLLHSLILHSTITRLSHSQPNSFTITFSHLQEPLSTTHYSLNIDGIRKKIPLMDIPDVSNHNSRPNIFPYRSFITIISQPSTTHPLTARDSCRFHTLSP